MKTGKVANSARLVAMLLVGSSLGCFSGGDFGYSGLADSGPLEVGGRAPNFVLAEVNKGPLELRESLAENDIVLINFWATWCGPCLIEMPVLEQLYEKYRYDGFSILSVNEDDDRTTLDRFLADNPLPFPVLYDSEKSVMSRYEVYGFPTSILVDKEGTILYLLRGYHPYMGVQIEQILQGEKGI